MTAVKLREENVSMMVYQVTFDGLCFIVKDFYNEKGKVIDSVVLTEGGEFVEDPITVDECHKLVDDLLYKENEKFNQLHLKGLENQL